MFASTTPESLKKPPYIVIVEDQEVSARRIAVRLEWRGIPEEHIVHFSKASDAVAFINKKSEQITGVVADYYNGPEAEVTGAGILALVQEKNPHTQILLLSSENRSTEPDVDGKNIPFCLKHQHQNIGPYLNAMRDAIPEEFRKQPRPDVLFQKETAIFRDLFGDFHAIMERVFGVPPFTQLLEKNADTVSFYEQDRRAARIITTSGDKIALVDNDSEYPENIQKIQLGLLELFQFMKRLEGAMREVAEDPLNHPNIKTVQDYAAKDAASLRKKITTPPLDYTTLQLDLQPFLRMRQECPDSDEAYIFAAALRHDVNHLISAVKESVEGFESALKKLETHARAKPKTVFAVISDGLADFLLNIIRPGASR